MNDTWATELRELSAAASALAESGDEPSTKEALQALDSAANRVATAWSGSNLGYLNDDSGRPR